MSTDVSEEPISPLSTVEDKAWQEMNMTNACFVLVPLMAYFSTLKMGFNIFVRNVGCLPTHYMVLCSIRQNSTNSPVRKSNPMSVPLGLIPARLNCKKGHIRDTVSFDCPEHAHERDCDYIYPVRSLNCIYQH
jgi:hypothetical protein